MLITILSSEISFNLFLIWFVRLHFGILYCVYHRCKILWDVFDVFQKVLPFFIWQIVTVFLRLVHLGYLLNKFLPLLTKKSLIPITWLKENPEAKLFNRHKSNCYCFLFSIMWNHHRFSKIRCSFKILRKEVEYLRNIYNWTVLTPSKITLRCFNIKYWLILLLLFKIQSLWLNYTFSLTIINYLWV